MRLSLDLRSVLDMVQGQCLVAYPHDPYFVALNLSNHVIEPCRVEFWDPRLKFGRGPDLWDQFEILGQVF
jgi:hypothetical protein